MRPDPGAPVTAGEQVELVRVWDRMVLRQAGVDDVAAADTAGFPALEFRVAGAWYRLDYRDGASKLTTVDGTPVCEFTYSSALCTMRYRLRGWDDTIPIPRRPVAYMVAMQINALVEHDWQYGDLFHASH